jgi:hypothetical protein
MFCVFCVNCVKNFYFWFALCVRPRLGEFDRSTPTNAHTHACSAFDLALVSSTEAPQQTHTLMHACGRTYPVSSNAKPFCTTCAWHECGRTHLSQAITGPIFRSLFPLFFPSSPSAVQPSPPPSPFPTSNHSLTSKITITHHKPTTPHPTAGLSSAISPTTGRPLDYFSHFSQNPISPKSLIFFIFLINFGHKSTLGL